jgi:hypothetical protein
MAGKRKAAPASLVRDVTPLREAFLDCRAEGHQWRRQAGNVDPIDVEEYAMRPSFHSRAVGRRSTCTSCGCERIRWYTSTGEVLMRYHHPDGYLHKKEGPDGEPAPTRQEWRQLMVSTLFDTDLRVARSA